MHQTQPINAHPVPSKNTTKFQAMAGTTSKYPSVFIAFLFFCNTIPIVYSNPSSDDLDHPMTFIVHMAKSQKPSLFTSHHHWYNSIIKSLPHSNHPSKIIYTYEKVVNGFSASLTLSQAEKLKDIPGVLFVTNDQIHKIQTTHSYRFLGLSENYGLWPYSNYGEDIIIGVLDSGIWPEHRSFSDTGLSPVPSAWKGSCEVWTDFPVSSCNRKLIGARAFLAGYSIDLSVDTRSPRDTSGHGTHVASIAAGAAVPNASYGEYASGTAIGIATKARIAIYKVCINVTFCLHSDMLAGMDQAVIDGVHIISMSISGGNNEYYRDNIAIASFGAMQKNVLVSVAGGNDGPSPFTVHHLPPWVLTVGASTINRAFRTNVVLGDSRTYVGASLYNGPALPSRWYQLAYAGNFLNPFCKFGGFINPNQLAGKIIVCEEGNVATFDKTEAVYAVGGVGLIITNLQATGEELQAEPHLIPGVRVNYNDGIQIKRYIGSSQIPTATILFRGTNIGTIAPKVAAFSSRGPNPITPQILKPDVIAPGVNILAAWTQAVGPWGIYDSRRVEFNIISGTSMACPHVSGIAAMLRGSHPNWSTAAIKSAIMTTAYNLDNSGQPIEDLATGTYSTPFAHGAGHIVPNKALDPGLVYDMGEIDYIGFLCSIGYDYRKISILSRNPVSSDICAQTYAALGGIVAPGDLNLPSFSIVFNFQVKTVTYKRTVKNVGGNTAIYVASWYAPPGTGINIAPNRLVFSSDTTILTYEVTFTSTGGSNFSPRFGWIEWVDGTHRVRSPVAFRWATTITTTADSVASISSTL